MQEGVLEQLRLKDMPKGGKVIKSSLGLINSSSQYGGYKNGDLIMVCLRPKAGKSTFMIQEEASAADQGFKVCHMAFGDFTELDVIHKMMSCITGDLISNVVNAPELYKKRCESWLDNTRVAAFPAFGLDTTEVIAYARNLKRKWNYDIIILDYDSNIRPPQDNSMYESGGFMYSSFKGFAQQDGIVVMIGCQPKIQYWDDEVLGFSAPNESSRKQHVIDYMITGGRNKENKNVGTFSIPLVRRGESGGMTKVRFDDIHSRIIEISSKEYESLLRAHKDSHSKVSDVSLEGISFGSKAKGNK